MSKLKTILILLTIITLGLFAYGGWYSYERQTKITKAENCKNQMENPGPILQICSTLLPPSIWDLVRGRIVVQGLPDKMKLNPYSFKDVLLGNYTATIDFGPKMTGGSIVFCDQSATTTDCSKLPPTQQSEPRPYVPPNVSQPTYTFFSATDTPITVAGFSFVLPPGWKVEAYARQAQAGWNIGFQKGEAGFSMECPPSGKGYEEATQSSRQKRSFMRDNIEYEIRFEQWKHTYTDPWYFLIINAAQKGGEFHTDCLAQAKIKPDITEAMQMFYDTLNIP